MAESDLRIITTGPPVKKQSTPESIRIAFGRIDNNYSGTVLNYTTKLDSLEKEIEDDLKRIFGGQGNQLQTKTLMYLQVSGFLRFAYLGMTTEFRSMIEETITFGENIEEYKKMEENYSELMKDKDRTINDKNIEMGSLKRKIDDLNFELMRWQKGLIIRSTPQSQVKKEEAPQEKPKGPEVKNEEVQQEKPPEVFEVNEKEEEPIKDRLPPLDVGVKDLDDSINKKHIDKILLSIVEKYPNDQDPKHMMGRTMMYLRYSLMSTYPTLREYITKRKDELNILGPKTTQKFVRDSKA